MTAKANGGARQKSAPSADDHFEFACPACGETVPASLDVWRCECGKPMSPVMPAFEPDKIEESDRSVWRYRRLLPLADDKRHPGITLGEAGTPLLPMALVGIQAHFKLEFLQPTGSYKDRGSAVLATALSRDAPRLVTEDSSGNAGASMAAYLARANIGLQLFVPGLVTPGALRQATAYGASIDQSAESRAEAAEMAMGAVSKTQRYASHVYSPYFLAGTMTLAYELWEDLGRSAPDNIVLPVGQGVLALGLYQGFAKLKEAGLVKKLPRLFGVQSRACAPVYDAFNRGSKSVVPVAAGATAAYGIAVADPPRGSEVVAAIRASKGALMTVSDTELTRAQALLANVGWYVEPTAAVAVAGLVKLDKRVGARETVVVPLTGNGLKA